MDRQLGVATYVSPEDSEISDPETVSAAWKTSHVREGHYFLRIVKCSNRTCCSEPRSNYFRLMHRFIPAPMCVSKGASLNDNSNSDNNFPSLFLRMALNDDNFKIGIQKFVEFIMAQKKSWKTHSIMRSSEDLENEKSCN